MDTIDIDPIETKEWLDALASVLQFEGTERAQYILQEVIAKAREKSVELPFCTRTAYANTIAVEHQAAIADEDVRMHYRINALMRWNAMAMVLRAGKFAPELGGHIATFASAVTLYEIGFNHFFRAPTKDYGGDLVFIQGHSSPGIYARAFLEGRLTAEQLDNFRQEVNGKGISSYPHPWLMPHFWQFPTVSMGLGPIQSIYQARFMKYLDNRGLTSRKSGKIWVFCGDGEMDEPESKGALTFARRERLDNLIFVINCNLQRLDGPVFGNGQIVQELEGLFRGAGWNVIKVIWDSSWDELFARDKGGWLLKRMNEVVDGEYQNYEAKDGAYFRKYFFGKYPELEALVADKTDEELDRMSGGGNDPRKVFAAYSVAIETTGRPTVILAKTIKGFGMGEAGEGRNIAHQQKKMELKQIRAFRDRFKIPVADDTLEQIPYCHPGKDSPEIKYILQKRKALGGFIPHRDVDCDKLQVPKLNVFERILKGSNGREISTTMAFVQILSALLKDKNIGKFIVPLVPDESRTFGMEGLFRQLGIYSPLGQLYEPEDKAQIMYYREAKDGQFLQEGLSEAGGFCSWLAAATSYSNHGFAMIPFYVFYSMFGFQRIGDLAWAAGDMQARGFLVGGLSGRTTLPGEGLQHQDGHNIVFFSTIPNCVCYDPTFAYEYVVIIHDGLRRMYANQENVFYYITVGNENYVHPQMPKGVEEGILKGMYLLQPAKRAKQQVQLLGSGAITREVLAAAKILQDEFAIAADVWNVTSFSELRREALAIYRYNQLHPDKTPKISYVTQCLKNTSGPIIAATDYVRLFADQIRAFLPNRYYVLGTDGFGRSDTRKQLRHFFEVDAKFIAYTAIKALADQGQYPAAKVTQAMKKLGIDASKADPVTQ